MSDRISLAEWDEQKDGRWRLTVAAQGDSTRSWVVPYGPPDDPLTLDDLRVLLPAAQDTAALLRDIEHPDANDYAAALERVRNALKGATP